MLFSFLLHVFYKISPSQKSVTLTLENNLFASVGCENAQMAPKRALEWTLRINDGYFTMCYGIMFRGGGGSSNTPRLASCYGNWYKLGPCGPFARVHLYLNLTLSSWRWLFLLNDYKSMAISFVTKLNFWRRKHYRIRLDFFLYIWSWFMAMINTTVCWSSLFSTDLKRHQYKLEFELFVFEHNYFWKTAEFTFPFFSWTAYIEVVYLWFLVLFISMLQWFGTIEQFCMVNVCFPEDQNKDTKNSISFSVSI